MSYSPIVVAFFQEEALYTPSPFVTIKSKLRHLNKKRYPDGTQMLHTLVFNCQQLVLVLKNYQKCLMLFISLTLHYQLRLVKSFKFCSIVSFVNIYNKYMYLDFNTMFLKYNTLAISKLQTPCFYHKYFKYYNFFEYGDPE